MSGELKRKGTPTPLQSQFDRILAEAATAFAKRCQEGSARSVPLADWEIRELLNGVQSGVVQIQGCEFLIDGQPSPYSMFTFNREYFTHFAAYVEALGWDVPDKRVVLEYQRLDIVVFSGEQPVIGIEVKNSERNGADLIQKMEKYLSNPPMDIAERGNDALVKVKRLLEIRPQQFMVITPERRWHFRVEFVGSGIRLDPLPKSKLRAA